MINPEWTRCVVALGTNLGDRQDIAFRALADVAATEGFRVVASSSLHETVALTPHGFDSSAPGYLNQVLVLNRLGHHSGHWITFWPSKLLMVACVKLASTPIEH